MAIDRTDGAEKDIELAKRMARVERPYRKKYQQELKRANAIFGGKNNIPREVKQKLDEILKSGREKAEQVRYNHCKLMYRQALWDAHDDDFLGCMAFIKITKRSDSDNSFSALEKKAKRVIVELVKLVKEMGMEKKYKFSVLTTYPDSDSCGIVEGGVSVCIEYKKSR